MLRIASFSDHEEIQRLWQSCFGDAKAYIDLYLNKKFNPQKTVLLEKDQNVIGMVHLLPCTLYPNQKALYWYAACIDENMRGKGYFRYLVTEVLKETKRRGFANLCVPAPGLETVYQKFGFSFPYLAKDITFEKDNSPYLIEEISIQEAKPEDFFSLFREEGSTVWSHDALLYAFIENEFSGGKQIKIHIEDKTYFGFAIRKEENYLIDYHNINIDAFVKIKDAVMDYLNTDKIIFRTVGGDKIVGLSDFELVNSNSRITMTLG